MFFFILFLSLLSFVSATCTNYLDDGDDPYDFGYVLSGSIYYEDTCTSSTRLKEYYCGSGASFEYSIHTCVACNEGICYSSSCSTSQECNPVLRKWCSGGSWSSSDYCEDSTLECYLVDSTCDASTCTTGACDYENHMYCEDNEWLSKDYCDSSHCGEDSDSYG